jgi:hypothetical protein
MYHSNLHSHWLLSCVYDSLRLECGGDPASVASLVGNFYGGLFLIAVVRTINVHFCYFLLSLATCQWSLLFWFVFIYQEIFISLSLCLHFTYDSLMIGSLKSLLM